MGSSLGPNLLFSRWREVEYLLFGVDPRTRASAGGLALQCENALSNS